MKEEGSEAMKRGMFDYLLCYENIFYFRIY